LAQSGPAGAGGVAVLRSSDLPVYTRTVEAIRRAYPESLTEVTLTDLPPDQAIERVGAGNPEIVVAVGLKAATLVRDRMPRVPMVYCMVPSPERHDLVGSRITGVSADIPPVLELTLLHETAPDARRVGVIVGRNSDDWLKLAEPAAAKVGVILEVARVGSIDQLGPRVRALLDHVDALWMPADADVATPEAFRFAMAEALKHRLPFFTFAPALVRAGAYAAATPDLDWVAGRIVEAVRRVQSGERAGDVPSTEVKRVKLVANLSTARALGRELPATLLRDAELVR
jgi:putative ABC transport system substrate-binding protein